MHKTIAEAEAFIAGAAAAGRRASRTSTSPSARRSPRCRRCVDSARGSRRAGLRAEHARGGPRRVHRRGLRADARPSSTCTASCSGTPSAASTTARPTARCSRRSRRRSRPACMPILCVGETEEERERGDTERKLRHQVQEGLEKVADGAAARGRRSPTSRSGRSAPARSRRPSRRRRRSRSCARWSRASTRPPGRRCGSSTAARSSPTTRPSCSRCPTSTARSSAARRSTRTRSRRSSRPRAR